MTESPIFVRTHDLLLWLIPLTVKFPRQQRFVMAAALQREVFAMQEFLFHAVRSKQPRAALLRADVSLAQLRSHFRLSHQMQMVSAGQYAHGAKLIDEVGRLLGAWLKGKAE